MRIIKFEVTLWDYFFPEVQGSSEPWMRHYRFPQSHPCCEDWAFVNPSRDIEDCIKNVELLQQLHGDESLEFCSIFWFALIKLLALMQN